MLVTFAASVAGVADAHELRGKFVAEISLEDPFFDQDSVLRGVAFIVDIDGAAARGHGAIIDDGALIAGDALAQHAGECGSFLAIEVGFEAVADSFMQQDPGPAGTEHHFHLASGSLNRIELNDGLARGFLGKVLGSLLRLKEFDADSSSASGAAARGVGPFFREAEYVEARERLRIGGVGAVGADDENAAELVGVSGADLKDAGIVSACSFVGPHDEIYVFQALSGG